MCAAIASVTVQGNFQHISDTSLTKTHNTLEALSPDVQG